MPGVAGAGAFLGMFWLLGAPWLWLSAVLALGVYWGVKWILPAKTPAEEASSPDPRVLLRTLANLIPPLSPPSLQAKLVDVCEKADLLLRYAEANPVRAADSQFVVTQYLDLTQTGVERYLETARFGRAGAQQSLRSLDELLDGVLVRFNTLYDKLLSEDDAALASELQVLNRTLKDLDEVVVQLQGKRL